MEHTSCMLTAAGTAERQNHPIVLAPAEGDCKHKTAARSLHKVLVHGVRQRTRTPPSSYISRHTASTPGGRPEPSASPRLLCACALPAARIRAQHEASMY